MVSVFLSCLWVVAVNSLAALLPRRLHGRAALVLVSIGIPLVGYVTYQNGALIGVITLLAGIVTLRWPVPRLLQLRQAG